MTIPIHVVVVAYGLADDLRRLYESIAHPEVALHIYLHSTFADVVQVCNELAERPQVTLYAYGTNRGLATSWNDGLLAAYEAGAEVAMIANDDAYAAPGDVFRLAEHAIAHRDLYAVSGEGLDVPSNTRRDLLFSLCAVNPIALEQIGMMDENFFPIYWEDIDWYRRAALAGLRRECITTTNLVHQGSKSRTVTPIAHDEQVRQFRLNRDYYIRKWGGTQMGDQGEPETYVTPFNDPHLGLYIAPADRRAPYPGYNRVDQEIVTA